MKHMILEDNIVYKTTVWNKTISQSCSYLSLHEIALFYINNYNNYFIYKLQMYRFRHDN